MYFLDTDTPVALFDKIDENQQFYINGKDEIVICFAEGMWHRLPWEHFILLSHKKW